MQTAFIIVLYSGLNHSLPVFHSVALRQQQTANKTKPLKMTYVLHYYIFELEGYKKRKKQILKTIYGLYRIKKGGVLSGKQQTKQKLVKMTYVLHY